MKPKEWSELSGNPISEEAITALFSKKDLYRISKKLNKPDENHAGTHSMPTIVVCLEGGCNFITQDGNIELREKQYAKLSPGDYYFHADKQKGSLIFKIYELYKKH